MSRSAAFVENARVQTESPAVSDSPEEWRMSDNTMMHLFAQVRHIQARITVLSTMSDVAALVASRSMVGNFQMALGCAVMTDWCYSRSESAKSDPSVQSYYESLSAAWDEKYEACVKYYNAPFAVLMGALDAIALPSE